MTESPYSDPVRDKGAQTSGAGLSWLALLVAVVALAASGWLWWQSENSGGNDQQAAVDAARDQRVQQLETRVDALQAQMDGVDVQGTGARISTLEQQAVAVKELRESAQNFQTETAAWTRSLQAAVEGDQARIAGLESRLAVLAERQMDTRAELDLAEIDYVLRLAQERLQLFGDSRSADRALALADRQVAGFDNPMFIGLRREIASAREQLAGIEQPDLVALDNELDEAQSGLATLRFRGESHLPAEQAELPEAASWWERLKGAFSGLVTVRRDSELENATPVLADQEAIRQSARLQLDLARLAVMRRDQLAYAAALGRASDIVQNWFENSDARTATLLESLARLREINIDPALPDISAPWAALQAIRAGGIPVPSAPGTPPAQGDAETPNEATANDPGPGESGQ